MGSARKIKSDNQLSSGQRTLYLLIKRLSDLLISFTLLLLLTPLMVVIMYYIYKKEGKPLFTIEKGFKKNNKPFDMKTFRVKSHPSEVIRRFPPKPTYRSKYKQKMIPPFRHEKNNPPIMTPTGYWLSRFKLHKLPLLIHVLKGDMSLIGTKIPIVDIVRQCHIRSIKPMPIKQGIIGYSDAIPEIADHTKQLAQYDLYYIENCSYGLDIKIMLLLMEKWFRKKKREQASSNFL